MVKNPKTADPTAANTAGTELRPKLHASHSGLAASLRTPASQSAIMADFTPAAMAARQCSKMAAAVSHLAWLDTLERARGLLLRIVPRSPVGLF